MEKEQQQNKIVRPTSSLCIVYELYRPEYQNIKFHSFSVLYMSLV